MPEYIFDRINAQHVWEFQPGDTFEVQVRPGRDWVKRTVTRAGDGMLYCINQIGIGCQETVDYYRRLGRNFRRAGEIPEYQPDVPPQEQLDWEIVIQRKIIDDRTIKFGGANEAEARTRAQVWMKQRTNRYNTYKIKEVRQIH